MQMAQLLQAAKQKAQSQQNAAGVSSPDAGTLPAAGQTGSPGGSTGSFTPQNNYNGLFDSALANGAPVGTSQPAARGWTPNGTTPDDQRMTRAWVNGGGLRDMLLTGGFSMNPWSVAHNLNEPHTFRTFIDPFGLVLKEPPRFPSYSGPKLGTSADQAQWLSMIQGSGMPSSTPAGGGTEGGSAAGGPALARALGALKKG